VREENEIGVLTVEKAGASKSCSGRSKDARD
jgi:hypothetical protein